MIWQTVLEGKAYVGHAESRKEELQQVVSDVLAKGSIDVKLAESLRGRMQWFETFPQGRIANAAVKKLGDLAFLGRKTVQLNDRDKSFLLFLRDRVLNAPPVCIESSSVDTWVVFVDGACEGQDVLTGSIGGVLMSPAGRIVHHFSSRACERFMKACDDSLNPIYELELLPMFVAVLVWGNLFKGSQVVFYGDNDAARASFIAGRASTSVGECIMSSFVTLELQLQLKSWFSRVPTSSWNRIEKELDLGRFHK